MDYVALKRLKVGETDEVIGHIRDFLEVQTH